MWRILFSIVSLSVLLSGCNSKTADIEVNLPDLAYFVSTPEHLMKYLAISAEWECVEEIKEAVCYSRQKRDGRWQRPFNGYVSVDTPSFSQTRQLFRFSDTGGGPFTNSYNRSYYTQLDPVIGHARMKIDTRYGMGRWNSYVAIGGKGLWYEFFEERVEPERISTSEALERIRVALSNVRADEPKIDTGMPESLPEGSFFHLKPELRVENIKLDPEDAVFSAGRHKVSAWVNPGEIGYIFAKIKNEQTGKYLQVNTKKEYIGWSKKADMTFLYEDEFRTAEGAPYGEYDATFEIWFHPKSAIGEERLLLMNTEKTQGWYR